MALVSLIKQVSHVLEPDHYFVLGERLRHHFNWGFDSSLLHGSSKLAHSSLLGDIFESICEEVLHRIIGFHLDLSLSGCSISLREHVNVVCCWHTNAFSDGVSLIKPLTHAFPVHGRDSSVLHELNTSWVERTARLWSVVHDSEDSLSSDVFHGDRRIDRIVIGGHILIRVVVVCMDVPCWSVIENSLLHLQPIRVSPERVIIVKVLNAEVDDDLMAVEVIVNIHLWKTVQIHIKLESVKISVNTDMHDGLLNCLASSVCPLKVEAHHLTQVEITICERSIFVLAVHVWLILACSLAEDVVARLLVALLELVDVELGVP